ncbi:vacuolar protein sorting-associated protein 21 [[Candida] anglica]|uniref:Vacuolar protein sorting-associated protein 21 n=1 Tax=[Candida] anglica TaxID=148631 RepID=A0ABP0EME7_9ASCO
MVGPPPYKLVLLGDSSVGKTSLVHRFATDNFDEHTANTIGAAFITKEYDSTNTDRKVKFEIWDTAGQERYRSLTPMYYRNAKIALVCYDLSNLDSFDKCKYWIDQLNTTEDNIQIKLVGNKSDLLAEDADMETIEEFCNSNNIPQYKTSAKSGSGIPELFSAIIDEIDESIFTDYNERQIQEEEASRNGSFGTIDFLNARFRNPDASSTCC